jgi:hypothetical protein
VERFGARSSGAYMQRVTNCRSCRCLAVLGCVFFLHFLALAETFKNPLLVLTGSDPYALSQGDFNGDGFPDIAYFDGSGLHILQGKGDGTFQRRQTISLPPGIGGTITVADVDADGKLDLLFGGLNPKAQIGVALGKGDGTFGSVIVSTFPLNLSLYASIGFHLGVADFNGDGAADVIASDSQNTQIYVLLGNNTGSFTLGSVIYDGSYPADAWTGDFNGDGNQDFLVHGGLGADVQVFLGNGDGTFEPGVTYGGGIDPNNAYSSVVLADMNGDGHVDLVVGTNASTVSVLLGNADGTFATTSAGGLALNSYGRVVDVGDFNSDGTPDIAVVDGDGLNILLGTGNLTYATPAPYGLSTSATGSALADFNHDGYLDFALVVPGGVALMLGKANGAFQSFDVYAMGQPAAWITSADFNGDHVADIAVAEQSSGPGILLGKGDGTFTLQPNTAVSGGTGSIALSGDFNGDGKTDLYFTGINSSGVVLFGKGNGTFGPPVDLTSFQQVGFVAAAAADFNNDGRTDLVSLNYQSFDILLGQSNETFNLLTTGLFGVQSSIAPAIADFNKDGRADMITAGVTTLQVLLGNGDGTFTVGRNINTQLPGYQGLCGPDSLAAADLDGDGNLDLVVPISCAPVAEIFYGKGDGTFEDPVTLQFEQGYDQVSIADLNGDHLPDLVFSNQAVIAVVHNAGHRTYSAETHYLAGTVGHIVIQDFNGDGFPDIAVAGTGNTVAVLMNHPNGRLTTGTLTVQPEPSNLTKPFSMTLTLAPFPAGSGTPTGTVTFSVDDDPVATVALNGSTATYTYQSSSLSLGSHLVTAVYNGDANFVPTYLGAPHQVIPIEYPTTIALTAHPTSILAGQTVSFHASVTSPGQKPYGTVSFLDGTVPMGAISFDPGKVAVFDTSLLSPGNHSVTAHFLGNQDFSAGTSSSVKVVVNVTQTTTTLTANPATVATGAPVLLTATAASSSGAPTGSIVFYDGGTFLQNTALDGGGVAVYSAVFSTPGTHVISATYLANASFASSTSSPVAVSVTADGAANSTSTTLTATASSQIARGFSFAANVTARNGSPNGNVIFLDGSSRLAVVELDETGTATYQSASLSSGVHYISAFYTETARFGSSASRVVVESMPADLPDFSMTLSSPSKVVVRTSASTQVELNSTNGFTESVTLSCSTGTPRISCSLQSPIIAGGTGASTLTISRSPTTTSSTSSGAFLKFAGAVAAPILCLAFFTKRRRPIAALSWITLLTLTLVGCGSPTSLVPEATVNEFVVTVRGTTQQSAEPIIHTVAVPVEVVSN